MAKTQWRPDPGNLKCNVVNCAKPLGSKYRGFTERGLIVHTSRMHKHTLVTISDEQHAENMKKFREMEANGTLLLRSTNSVDYGTPGDEVIISDSLRMPSDFLSSDELPQGPVESLPSKGVPGCATIQVRDKKLYVSVADKSGNLNGWEETDLEQFFSNVRFAVRIS